MGNEASLLEEKATSQSAGHSKSEGLSKSKSSGHAKTSDKTKSSGYATDCNSCIQHGFSLGWDAGMLQEFCGHLCSSPAPPPATPPATPPPTCGGSPPQPGCACTCTANGLSFGNAVCGNGDNGQPCASLTGGAAQFVSACECCKCKQGSTFDNTFTSYPGNGLSSVEKCAAIAVCVYYSTCSPGHDSVNIEDCYNCHVQHGIGDARSCFNHEEQTSLLASNNTKDDQRTKTDDLLMLMAEEAAEKTKAEVTTGWDWRVVHALMPALPLLPFCQCMGATFHFGLVKAP